MKSEHASLLNEKLCVSNTLEEKVDIANSDTCLILKIEIENLKGKLTHVITSLNIISIISNYKGKNFSEKPLCH